MKENHFNLYFYSFNYNNSQKIWQLTRFSKRKRERNTGLKTY